MSIRCVSDNANSFSFQKQLNSLPEHFMVIDQDRCDGFRFTHCPSHLRIQIQIETTVLAQDFRNLIHFDSLLNIEAVFSRQRARL